MNTKHSTSFTVYPEMCNFMNEGKMVHGGYMLMMMDRVAAECSRRLLYDAKSIKDRPSEIELVEIKKVFCDMSEEKLEIAMNNAIDSMPFIKANSALTVNVTDVTFFVGASLGDIIFLSAEVIKLGNKRIEIQVTGEREDSEGNREKICEGKFIFCAMYNASQSVAHGLTLQEK